ncbi:hypothetical protein GCM10010295_29890 [Streptomyces intermedius]
MLPRGWVGIRSGGGASDVLARDGAGSFGVRPRSLARLGVAVAVVSSAGRAVFGWGPAVRPRLQDGLKRRPGWVWLSSGGPVGLKDGLKRRPGWDCTPGLEGESGVGWAQGWPQAPAGLG